MFCIHLLSRDEAHSEKVRAILAASVFRPEEDEHLDQALRYYDDIDTFLFCARLYGEPVGLVGCRREPGVITIMHIATSTAYRHRNIGRKLIAHVATAWPRDTLVAETNDHAVGFYRQCGFVVDPIEPIDGVRRYRCRLDPSLDRDPGHNAAHDRPPEVTYGHLSSDGLEQIASLWEKLNQHHRVSTIGWAGHFTRFRFERRAQMLADKTKRIRIDVARDSESQRIVGYCICSVDDHDHGELESIFVERRFRGIGVGERLAQSGLRWIEEEGASETTIVVAVGNERAIPFYEKLGFSPRTYRLKKRPVERQ
jgi:ribosomal protein S18 acetylase RimI-like enzyme